VVQMSDKLIILILVIFCGTMLAAQVTTPEKPAGAVKTVIPDKPAVPETPAVHAVKEKPAEKKAVVKVKPPQKKAKIVKKEVEAKPVDNASDGRLLPIKEGSFKYKRIPEIVIEEAEKGEEEDFVHIPDENLEESGKNTVDTGEKGFLGLKRETSDWVAKVGLALLLIIVFLLYRVRSRGSRSVHRSFPK